MASRHSNNHRMSRHSEHDDRFDNRHSRNNERTSRRFDEFSRNRDMASKYDEDSTRHNDKGITKFQERRQKYSRNDNELQENLENKIKFQESFGIERRPSRKFDQEILKNTKKVVEDSEISGRSSETSNVGQFKDLRQLLQSKRRESQDEKIENEKRSSISTRLGPKIKEEVDEKKNDENLSKFDDKPKAGRNSSRFGENSARLVSNLLNMGRRPAKTEDAASKVDNNSPKADQTSNRPETPSEAPQRVRKPIRVRNPANRLADLVRLQVVDAVKRNEKRETNSASSKSASHESLIEISSSSDDVKVVEVKSSVESGQNDVESAMDRLKTDFDEISSSGSENWVDIIDEEEKVKNLKQSTQKHQKVDLRTKIVAALRQGREQSENITKNQVHFKEPTRPEPKNLQRSSSMSSLAENKPKIQKHQSRIEPQRNHHQRPQFESERHRNQPNRLQRTHSNHFHAPRPNRIDSRHFEAPQSIRPEVTNSAEFQQFRFGPTYSQNQPGYYRQQQNMPKTSNWSQNPNWNEYQQRNAQFRGITDNITSNSYQDQEQPQQISVVISNYQQDENLTSNYQEIPNLTSNYQEDHNLTSNTQNIPVITTNTQNIPPLLPNLYNYPPPTSQFQPQNHFDSNVHQFMKNFQESARFKQRTPSPAPSSSSSSSSSVTDLLGAPSKLEARLKKIRGNEKKFSDGNKSSSLESLKSNGFNANAKVFYPKQTDTAVVPYQQQVEITEPVYYDSHHSFELSAYVDESLDEVEEPSSNKLTHEQMINLLYVTKTSEKYMNEALSYYVEYYDELGCNLSKNAVDEILTAKGIESKACEFNYLL